MSMVIAVREDSCGTYIGFQVDTEIMACSERTCAAAYRLRYTEDEKNNLKEHRASAHRQINGEHPNHSDNVRVA